MAMDNLSEDTNFISILNSIDEQKKELDKKWHFYKSFQFAYAVKGLLDNGICDKYKVTHLGVQLLQMQNQMIYRFSFSTPNSMVLYEMYKDLDKKKNFMEISQNFHIRDKNFVGEIFKDSRGKPIEKTACHKMEEGIEQKLLETLLSNELRVWADYEILKNDLPHKIEQQNKKLKV